MKRVIGIVGGMGPMAGIALMERITSYTPACFDQDHLDVILLSLPSIPDRTAYIEGKSVINPAYNIVEAILKLESIGAQVVGIACNTSYTAIIHDVIMSKLINAQSKVKLLNLPEEACKSLKEFDDVKRVGVMSTNGTYASGLYNKLLDRIGYQVVIPEKEFQNDVIHQIIYNVDYGIKSTGNQVAPQAKKMFLEALNYFRSKQANAVMLACTELSYAFKEIKCVDMILLDPLDVFAKSLISEALPVYNDVENDLILPKV